MSSRVSRLENDESPGNSRNDLSRRSDRREIDRRRMSRVDDRLQGISKTTEESYRFLSRCIKMSCVQRLLVDVVNYYDVNGTRAPFLRWWLERSPCCIIVNRWHETRGNRSERWRLLEEYSMIERSMRCTVISSGREYCYGKSRLFYSTRDTLL